MYVASVSIIMTQTSLPISDLMSQATFSGFSGSSDSHVPGALLKSIPASEAGLSACFNPYN